MHGKSKYESAQYQKRNKHGMGKFEKQKVNVIKTLKSLTMFFKKKRSYM